MKEKVGEVYPEGNYAGRERLGQPEARRAGEKSGSNGKWWGRRRGKDWEEGNYGMIAKFVSCMRAARVRSQIEPEINIKQKLSSNHDFWPNAK